MREHRQQLVFVVVLVVLGLATWSKVDEAYESVRMPRAGTFEERAIEVPPLVMPALANLGADGTSASPRGRSSFAPPRDLAPLDPIPLPSLPLPALPVLRPTVAAALGGSAAKVYRVPASALGALVLAEPDEGSEGLPGVGAQSAEAGQGAGDDGTPSMVASASGDTVGAGDAVVDNELRYDWLQRAGSNSRLYGRILNDDVFGLTERLGEAIRFQQITTRTGRPVGVPFVFDRSVDVERFGLARTFHNIYHLESRRLGQGAGAVADRTELALNMLAAAATEEEALSFAEAEARLAYAASPLDPFTLRVLATVLHEAHDVEGECQVYRQGLTNQTLDAALLADYAGLLMDLGLSHRADDLLSQAESTSRLAAEVAYQRGRQALAAGDADGALAAFAQAASGHYSPPFQERQRRQATLALGRALIAVGRLPESEREAQRLLLVDSSDIEALRLQASIQAARDETWQAADTLALALLEAPAHPGLLRDAGVMAWRLGQGDEALSLLQRAVASDPWQSLQPLLAVGFIHEDGGRGEAAREAYAAALRLAPDDTAGLYHLGRIERLDGDPEASFATLRTALRLGGPDVLLLSELGLSSLLSGHPGHGADYFAEALRLEPDNGRARWLHGLALLRQGDLLTAIDELALATQSGEPGAHAGLAVAQYELGEAQLALDHFDEVLRAFAGDEEHPVAVFAQAQASAIRDNLTKRQWVDTFGRSNLQRGWIERQWDGSPSLSHGLGESLIIGGRMENPREDERPGVSRVVEGRSFLSAEMAASAQPGGASRFGLVLTLKQVKGVMGQLPKARLEIWVDEAGLVRVAALDNFETVVLPGDALPDLSVPVGSSVRLGIERIDGATGAFQFTVDGRAVGQPLTLKALRDVSRNTLHVDLFGEAAPGRVCDVEVSRVRIVRRL